MTREELFHYIETIEDPVKDHGKILANLHYTHHYLMDRYKKILQEYGLTTIQSNVLGIIVHGYPNALSLEEICAMVLEPSADVSRTVVRLAQKGFIEKVKNKDNRRKLAIRANDLGVETVQKLAADPRFKVFTAGITLSESKRFVKFLKTLRREE